MANKATIDKYETKAVISPYETKVTNIKLVAPSIFTPSNISAFHWEADKETGYNDNDPVNPLTNQVEGGLNATQANSAQHAIFKTNQLGNFATVIGDGVDDFYIIQEDLQSIFRSNWAVTMIVNNKDGQAVTEEIFGYYDGGSGHAVLFQKRATSGELWVYLLYDGVESTYAFDCFSVGESAYYLITIYTDFDNNQIKFKKNKVLLDHDTNQFGRLESGVDISNINPSSLVLGSMGIFKRGNSGGRHWNGGAESIIIYSYSDQKVTDTENYLVNKFYSNPENFFVLDTIVSPAANLTIQDYESLGYVDPAFSNANYRMDVWPKIFTHNTEQFIPYYTWDGFIKFKKRDAYTGSFNDYSVKKITDNGDLPVDEDSHNGVCAEIDQNGFLHMLYNMHRDPLRYSKSTSPVDSWDGTWNHVNNMIGTNEGNVTYPRFFKRPDTNALMVIYRDGSAVNSTWICNEYDVNTKTWARKFDLFQIDGDGKYMSMKPAFDSNFGSGGFMHLIWSFRDGEATGSDITTRLSAIKWDGTNFYDYNDNQVTPPLTLDGSNYTVIDNSSGVGMIDMFSPTGLLQDGQPFVIQIKEDGIGNEQLWLQYFNGTSWVQEQITTSGNQTFEDNRPGDGSPKNFPEMLDCLYDSQADIIHVFALAMDNSQLLMHWYDDGTRQNWTEEILLNQVINGAVPFIDKDQWDSKRSIDILFYPIEDKNTRGAMATYHWTL